MEHKLFGYLENTPIHAHRLTDGYLAVTVIDYGARIASLTFGGRELVCGFDDMTGYLADKDYHGAIVGRYANRIRDGRFTLNGTEYRLAKNEKGRTHLHGGNRGFDSRIWTPSTAADNAITLTLFSPDGEEGYPGNLTVAVTYTLKEQTLSIDYKATCDADTVINLTSHAYFNIGGVGEESVHDQILQMKADAIAEVNDWLIPTGRLLPTAGTPFDFSRPKPIGKDIGADNEQLKNGGGYDHGFRLLPRRPDEPAALLTSPHSGITMEIFTTEGGIQMYTGNFMTADNPFFGGIPQRAGEAVALECNKLPDSPNRPEFPSPVLDAGETYRQTTSYRFSRRG